MKNRSNPNDKTNRRPVDPKLKKRRRILIWSGIGAAVVVLGGVAYGMMHRSIGQPLPTGLTGRYNWHDNATRTTILLVGTDTRPGDTGGNTDVMMVASIDNNNKRIEVLSIPRDTRVAFPDGSYQKINAAYNVGGIALSDRLVQDLIHVDIPYYAITHFGGLVNVIDTVGGVTLNVPEPMHFNTGDKQYGIIDLNKGYQHLSGAQALGFVRFREDALGDIGRTLRQHEFMSALEQALLQPSNITKLPALVSEFSSTITTNFTTSNLLGFASNASTYKGYKLISETLPGAYHNPQYPGDASYWTVNPAQAQWVAKQFFQNGIEQANPIETETEVNNWTPPLTNQNGTTDNSIQGTGSSDTQSNNQANNTTTLATTNSTNSAASDTNNTTNLATSTVTNSTTPSTAVAPVQMVVTGGGANIRSGPGTNNSIVGSLLQGNSVTVIGKSGQWDEVQLGNGASGYIADFLLRAK
jgi:LCP family protein required for cell wall assembly